MPRVQCTIFHPQRRDLAGLKQLSIDSMWQPQYRAWGYTAAEPSSCHHEDSSAGGETGKGGARLTASSQARVPQRGDGAWGAAQEPSLSRKVQGSYLEHSSCWLQHPSLDTSYQGHASHRTCDEQPADRVPHLSLAWESDI